MGRDFGRVRKIAFWIGNFSIGFYEEFREFNHTNSTTATDMVNKMQDLSTTNIKEVNIESLPMYVRRIGRAGAVVKGVKSFTQTPAGKAVIVALSEANPVKFM